MSRLWYGIDPYAPSYLCSAEGEQAEGASAAPEPASAEAAQEALEKSDQRPSLLTEEEPKPPEAEAVAVFDPAKLSIPEGVTLDEGIMQTFSKIAEGLPHSKAQGLVDFYIEQQRAAEQKNFDFWKTTRDGWVAEVRKDQELSKVPPTEVKGKMLSGLDAAIQIVKNAIADPSLTDPGFAEALNFTGSGDNPAVVKTLYRWASHLQEGIAARSGNVPAGIDGKPGSKNFAEVDAAEVLYPNLKRG